MPISPGICLGPYEIVSPLGAGGMGEVYKARDTRLDRTVAIKVIAAGIDDAASRHRLLREARAASTLNHPNICTIHDVGDADGRPFIAMEWLDGESLADRLSGADGPLPLDELLKYSIQTADALDAAHSAGIVHRDLKPANLFITRRGDIKILDFGLAKLLQLAPETAPTVGGSSDLTAAGAAVGTVAYMSPEQARGEPIDARTDLFSLGLVMYEMATGRRAFDEPTTALAFDAILNRQPVPVREVNRDLPSAVGSTINRLLAKDRDQRYESARALLRDLAATREAIQRPASASGTRIVPSIAVLPFTNVSADPENDYFADGITEEIMNALAQLKGLHVAARTSSFAFKGKTPDIADVAEKLRVAHVLTGSVRKYGTRLRITVQLVSAVDGFQVWSERYDRDAVDIFQIQDEIATAIATKLRVEFTGPADEPLVKPPTENLTAYDEYLKGRFLVNQRGAAIVHGLACFERALALEPDYALAHASVGVGLALLGFYGYAPAYEALPKARRYARNALARDASLADAHAVLMFVSFIHDWDWDETDREFARTITLNDRMATVYNWRALYLSAHGRLAELHDVLPRMTALDPLSALAHSIEAINLTYARRYEEAVAAGRRASELDAETWIGSWAAGVALVFTGHADEGIAVLEQCFAASGRHPWPAMSLTELYIRNGRGADAARIVDELIERSIDAYVPPITIATAMAAVNRADEAIQWWERAYREHDAFPVWCQWPLLPRLLGRDSRFGDVYRRIGLTPGPAFSTAG